MPINKKRMISSFIKLVKTDSPSLKEKAVALKLKEIFKKLGAKVSFDSAGKKTGGDTGNLIAKFRGTRAGKPFLLSAHMDTVGPSKNIKPLVKPNKIISGGDTILGADCKAGIAIIIEIIKVLKESKTPYPPIEVLLTVSEEIGLLGAKSLNYSLIKSNCGIIFDSERPLNEITANAPAVNRVEIDLIGIACHSGACPEKGISAIQVAAEAISKMKLGRIDFETTANIGIITGGSATNTVPASVKITGEVRSHKISKLKKQTNHMRECFEKSAKKAKAKFKFRVKKEFHNLNIGPGDIIMKLIKKSMNEMGMKMVPISSGGGTDANILYGHGIKTPIMPVGMRDVHSVKESLALNDFFNSAVAALKVISKL